MNMDPVMRAFDFLQSSSTVARFQRLCGIHSRRKKTGGIQNGCACHLNGATGLANGVVENGTQNHKIHKNGIGPHKNGYKNGLTKVHNSSNGVKHVSESNGGVDKEPSASESYEIRNNFLFYLFNFGANLGNEIFYITFFPFCLWNIDSLLARKVCIMWYFVMYIGQATKDIVRWPRPHSPPAVKLEERYALEYGMPSTHAMVGTVIPLGMTLLSQGRYEASITNSLGFITHIKKGLTLIRARLATSEFFSGLT